MEVRLYLLLEWLRCLLVTLTQQYNTIQYNPIQYNTIQYNTIQDNKHLSAELCFSLVPSFNLFESLSSLLMVLLSTAAMSLLLFMLFVSCLCCLWVVYVVCELFVLLCVVCLTWSTSQARLTTQTATSATQKMPSINSPIHLSNRVTTHPSIHQWTQSKQFNHSTKSFHSNRTHFRLEKEFCSFFIFLFVFCFGFFSIEFQEPHQAARREKQAQNPQQCIKQHFKIEGKGKKKESQTKEWSLGEKKGGGE